MSLGILNVGAGDTKLSFDSNDPVERIRAARMVKDMLSRGYILLVDVGDGKMQRAIDFDEKTSEYIIADFAPETAADEEAETQAEAQAEAPTPAKKKKKTIRRRRSAKSTKAVAVAKTAGG